MWLRKSEIARLKEIDEKYCDIISENVELREKIILLEEEYQNLRMKEKEIENAYQEARRLKHDMRNHLLVISSYLNEEKIEEAKSYTADFMDKMELDFSYIFSGNAVLNYILNEKFYVAKSCNIYVKAEVDNIKFSRISGIDFAAIVGNLLDNAIEAAAETREKQLHIQVKRKRGYDAIRISNSIDNSVIEKNPSFKTTKLNSESHGLGISQVKKIVNKYEGLLDIWEENEMFHVQVMFERR